MDLTALQNAAAGNDWRAIWPELWLAILALVLLVVDLAAPRRASRLVPALALLGQAALLAAMLCCRRGLATGEAFGGLLHLGHTAAAMRAFLVLASFLATLLARVSLDRSGMPRVEFYAILLVVTASLMLFAESTNFLMLFVALETATVGFYILVSYARSSAATLEAGLKYLILGALSSALLLFGIVLLYGAAGNPALPAHTDSGLHYAELATFLDANPHNFLASIGIILVLAGLAFKIGGFPFQIWIPDVYQGAPTPISAMLAVASKGAGFAVLLGLVRAPFAPYAWLTLPVLTVMAGATIIFGNLAALTQHNVKRLIGLSGVAHAGFLLLGVIASASSVFATGAVLFYLYAYLLASFAVFAVIVHLSPADDTGQELEHYAGLSKREPFLALLLAVGLGSLAGIPPLAGFVGKFLVFVAAFKTGHITLLCIALAGVVVSIYYYFGWIKAAFFEGWAPAPDAPPAGASLGTLERFILALVAFASVALGFFQGPLGRFLSW